MLEILLCSMVTILPDYLFRRDAQGKRFGHEITLYSIWFELRWGFVASGQLRGGDPFMDVTQFSRPETGLMRAIALHGIDAVGLVHAILLRMQTLLLPFKALVLSGH
jgi:hypothetical protein